MVVEACTRCAFSLRSHILLAHRTFLVVGPDCFDSASTGDRMQMSTLTKEGKWSADGASNLSVFHGRTGIARGYSSSFWYFRLRFCAATSHPEGRHGESGLRGRTRPYQAGWAGSAGLKTRHYKSAHARLPGRWSRQDAGGRYGRRRRRRKKRRLREGPACGRAFRFCWGK